MTSVVSDSVTTANVDAISANVEQRSGGAIVNTDTAGTNAAQAVVTLPSITVLETMPVDTYGDLPKVVRASEPQTRDYGQSSTVAPTTVS